jgi:hypothetical protein
MHFFGGSFPVAFRDYKVTRASSFPECLSPVTLLLWLWFLWVFYREILFVTMIPEPWVSRAWRATLQPATEATSCGLRRPRRAPAAAEPDAGLVLRNEFCTCKLLACGRAQLQLWFIRGKFCLPLKGRFGKTQPLVLARRLLMQSKPYGLERARVRLFNPKNIPLPSCCSSWCSLEIICVFPPRGWENN